MSTRKARLIIVVEEFKKNKAVSPRHYTWRQLNEGHVNY